MAIITIDQNIRIILTSNTSAEYPQSFKIERESAEKPDWWEIMGIYNGGDSDWFLPLSRISRWKITGSFLKDGKWLDTTQVRIKDKGSKYPKFEFNDNFPDYDYDDLFVQFELISPYDAKLGKDNFKEFDEKAKGGDGIFKQHLDKPLEELDEDGNVILPH
jgi:hypothetical protein